MKKNFIKSGGWVICAWLFAVSLSSHAQAQDYAGRGVHFHGGYNQVAPLSILTNPNVDVIKVSATWKKVEPTEGNYNWTVIDDAVSKAATYGKRVSLELVSGGIYTPGWVFTKGAASFKFLVPHEASPEFCNEWTMAVPWDPIYQEVFKKLIQALGARYGANPVISHVKAGGIHYRTAENALPRMTGQNLCNRDGTKCCDMYDDVQNWINAGYTRTKVEDAWKSIADVWDASFPGKGLAFQTYSTAFPPIDENGARIPGAGADRQLYQDIWSYGVLRWGSRFIMQNNGLSPTNVWDELVRLSSRATVGYQQLWFVTGDATCRMNGYVAPCDPHQMLNDAVRKGVLGGAQFLELYAPDIDNPALQDVIQYAHTALTEMTPPAVSITFPESGAVVSGVVSLSATATDDVAMRGVQFKADGNNIGNEDPAPLYTKLWDTMTVAPGWHTLTAVARDHLNNIAISNPVSVYVSEKPATVLSFETTADAYVDQAAPDSNFGTNVNVRLYVDGKSPTANDALEIYIRFSVNGVTGTIQSAKLRLYELGDTVYGPGAYLASGNWTENGITWNNQPGHTSEYPSDDGLPGTANTWYELNVTPFVTGNGPVDFHLASNPANLTANFMDKTGYASRSNGVYPHPQLVITVAPPQDTTAPASSVSGLNQYQTQNSFSVSWTGSDEDGGSGLKCFDVQYRDGSGGSWTDWKTCVTDTSVAFGPDAPISIANGTTYYFRSRGQDKIGNVEPYPDGDGDTHTQVDTTPPSGVSDVKDGLEGDIDWTASTTQLSANWTSSQDNESGAVKYWYAIGTAPGEADVLNWTENGTATSVTRTDLSLKNGTAYYFSVKAENGVGLQSSPSSSNGQTVNDLLPEPPLEVTATAGNAQILLNWTANTENDLAGYNVYRAVSQAGPYEKINSGVVTAIPYLDMDVANGAAYYYRMTAVDALNNESAQTAEVSASPFAKPSAPTNVLAEGSDMKVELTWTAPVKTTYDIAGYQIYRSATSGSGYENINTSLIPTTSYTDLSAVNGASFYYVITAVDTQNNESGNSGESSVKPSDTISPSAIADLAGGNVTADSITLTWTAAGDNGNERTAAAYDIRYAESPVTDSDWENATQVTGEPSPQLAGKSETFVVEGLKSEKTYYFAMKVLDEVSNASGLSNVVSIKTFTLPSPPENVTAKAEDKSVMLTWSPAVGGTHPISGYKVYRSTAQGSGYVQVGPDSITLTKFTDELLTNGMTYYYVVRTVDVQNNESLNSLEVSATPKDSVTSSLPSGLSMISVPIMPADKTAKIVLGLTSDFDLAKWVPEEKKYHRYSENSDDSLLQINAGVGYFVKLNNKKTATAYGDFVKTTSPFSISLNPGWNQIGNPYNFSVAWDDGIKVKKTSTGELKPLSEAAKDGWIAIYAWAYPDQATGYQLVHPRLQTYSGKPVLKTLDPWKGYWVKATIPCDLILSPVKSTLKAKVAQKSDVSDQNWQGEITAKAEELHDTGYFGVTDEAENLSVGKAPLPVSPYVSLSFVRNKADLAVDLVRPSNGIKIYELVVENDTTEKKVTLIWNLTGVPDSLGLTLIDVKDEYEVDMTTMSSYTYSNEPQRELRIKVQDKPKHASVSQVFNYPNPFSLTTGTKIKVETDATLSGLKADIYTLGGKRVQTVYLFENPGFNVYEVPWDGKDSGGRAVANGVYFYRIEVWDTAGRKLYFTGKMAIVK